jgi:hypothetical protein
MAGGQCCFRNSPSTTSADRFQRHRHRHRTSDLMAFYQEFNAVFTAEPAFETVSMEITIQD